MIDQANKAIRTVIRTAMGMPANSVRPADQDGPTGPADAEFATVKIISARDAGEPSVGQATIVDDDDNVTQTTEVTKIVVASVNFYKAPPKDATGQPRYSNAAFDRAANIVQRLNRASAILAMQQAGLGLISASPPRNLTGAVDSVHESRGQIDLTFSFVHAESETVPAITNAEVGLQVEWSPDRIEQRTLEVPS